MDVNLTLLKNTNGIIYINEFQKIIYIEILDPKYNRENYLELVEYLKNFWILTSYSDKKYRQIFICKYVDIYPLEFYDTFIKTLKSLDNIFQKHLHASCLINDSTAVNILRPILNAYKAIRPFKLLKTFDEGLTFVNSQILE